MDQIERHRRWTDLASAASALAGSGVVERFEAQARRSPDAVAVSGVAGESPALTYHQLDAAASRLARELQRRGAQIEERVAVEVDRSGLTVVALLGILKAGAVYVPIDPAYPPERIRLLRSDSGCRLSVHCGKGTTADAIGVGDLLAGGDSLWEGPPVDPGQLAYILYTSGSTGRPKGVMVEHRSLANVVDDHIRAFEATADDRILLFSSPAFDAYLFQVFVGLSVGATLVPLPAAILGDHQAFLDYLRQQEVTILSVPPAYLNALGRVPLGPVRLINTGGDASIPADALFHGRHARYLSTYGPTETTICSAWHEVDPEVPYPDGIPLGHPVANVALHVLGESLAPLPAGEVGEICIAGPGLARAYLNHPDLTAERFVPNPFAAGERLYRTGDLGRWRADGSLEFAGRRDRQVKVRGHRVEPAEIEQCLERHPGVDRAVVLLEGSDARAKRLVAYVVAPDGASAGELRSYLRERLPAASVPSAILRLEAMPLTVHGKVDTAALQALGNRLAEPARPPRTDAERVLAGLWEEVLGRAGVGLDDELLDLGGDSITAARLVSEMRRRLGLTVGIEQLLAGATVASLAARLETAGEVVPATLESTSEGAEASHSQRRLWLVHQLADEPGVYNLSQIYRLAGNLDLVALRTALLGLVARHPMLRATFGAAAGEPVLHVDEGEGFSPVLVDLTGFHEANATALAEELAAARFDLERGPLARAVILRTAPEAALLLFSVHHIVCDGWSFGILLQDLGTLYAAAVRGERVDLQPVAWSPGLRYGALQRSELAGTAGEAHRAYWLARLSGSAPLELPLDRPRPPEQRFGGATLYASLGMELREGLRQLGRQHRATLFMTAVALVKVLLARYTGQGDLTVGAPMTDRDALGLTGEVGFFVNTVVLRDRLDLRGSFIDLLASVRETCLEAYEHQVYPFDRIVEDLGLTADPSRSPVFDVMVALQRESDVRLALAGVEADRLPLTVTGSKFDLSFDFVEEDEGFGVAVEYATALFDPWRIRRAAGHLAELARAAVAEPWRPLEDLRMITEAEAAELVALQGSADLLAQGLTLADLFAAAARRDPDGLALVGGDIRWSYREVRGLVQGLAESLRRLPAFRPGDLVGILAERSPRFFVAVLAVLEAGAAYVPLDAGWPDLRIEQALDQAGCSVVLSDRAFVDLAPLRSRATLALDSLAGPESRPEPSAPTDWPVPESLAYCIFTSGSTGKPKGVAVTHANAAQAVHMWLRDYHLDRHLDRPVILQLASFAFDVSAGDLCRSLMVGGTLVVANDAERIEPAAIFDLVEVHGVTCFETTPVVARLLMRYLEETGRRLPSLGMLVVGSDVWYGEELDRLRGLLPPEIRLLNSYGTTETTVDSSFYEAGESRRGGASRYVPIGRPMSGVEMLVLDATARPVPVGIPGEVWIAGPGVSSGYLDEPALTATKFLPHPFCDGERIYRTGDLGVWAPDGHLEILGRGDRQAKVRGFRIELGEVESALVSHPAVEAAVAMIAGPPERGELAAYVVPRSPVDEAGLRRHLGEMVPPYMVPTAWMFLERLPTSGSGKVDRKALPPMRTGSGRADAAAPVAPRTSTEGRLLEVWRSVLPDGEAFGVEDPFFSLGGDSIRAVQVALAAKQAGFALRGIDLFRHPTIAELARLVESREGRGREPIPMELAAVDPEVAERVAGGRPAEDVYPALALQGFMLGASREHPAEEGVFHGQSTWRVRDPDLSMPALREALVIMIARHPALRTQIVEDGGLYQVVRPAGDVPVVEIDLARLPEARRRAEVGHFLSEDAVAGFPSPLPLCRFAIFRHAPDEIELIYTAHHAVDDGWGTTVLERDLFGAYDALRRGRRLPEVAPDVSCRELVALERESALSTVSQAFWGEELHWSAPPSEPRFETVSGRFGLFSLQGESAGATAARRRAAELGVSVKAFCLAALLDGVAAVLGPERAAAGVVMNGRSERLSDPLGALGLFWSLVPARGQGTGDELALDVERFLRRAEAHARHPLPWMTGEERPPFLACFNFLDLHGREPLPAGLKLLDSRWIEVFSFPLTVAVVSGSSMVLHLQHDRRHVSEEEASEVARRMLERLS